MTKKPTDMNQAMDYVMQAVIARSKFDKPLPSCEEIVAQERLSELVNDADVVATEEEMQIMNEAMDKLMNAMLGKGDARKAVRELVDHVVPPDDIEEMYKHHEENFEQKPIYHYEVIYNDANCEGGSFECWADNEDKAREQCERETPGCTVIKVDRIYNADFKDEVIDATFKDQDTILPASSAAIITEDDSYALLTPKDGGEEMSNHEMALVGCFLRLTEDDPAFREEMRQVALDHVASKKEQEQGKFDLN